MQLFRWAAIRRPDSLEVGTGYYRGSGPITRPFGIKFDWFKIYEADEIVDTDAPSAPVLSWSSPVCPIIDLSWTESTDATTEVVGYRIYRNGNYWTYLMGQQTTSYRFQATEGTSFTITVEAVDAVGNAAASNTVDVVVNRCYNGNQLTFQFDDVADGTYGYGDTFATNAKETDNYWFGYKGYSAPAAWTAGGTGPTRTPQPMTSNTAFPLRTVEVLPSRARETTMVCRDAVGLCPTASADGSTGCTMRPTITKDI
jgi:hypothetical protein